MNRKFKSTAKENEEHSKQLDETEEEEEWIYHKR